jgi:urease accessory protein
MARYDATSFVRANFRMESAWDVIVLDSAARHLRRKLLALQHGDEVLVDFDKAVQLAHGDCLVLNDGKLVGIIAADEDLLEITGQDAAHLVTLAWHIEPTRILIQRDRVIGHMLEHLGAKLRDVCEGFSPEHGAYHSHSSGDGHGHDH